MKNRKDVLIAAFNMFTRISTIIMLCSSVYIYLVWGADEQVDFQMLIEIPAIALITTIPYYFMFKSDHMSAKRYLLFNLLYFTYINVIVLFAGYFFGWFHLDNLGMIIGMVVTIFAVCVVVAIITYLIDWQTADKLNRKLRERESYHESEL